MEVLKTLARKILEEALVVSLGTIDKNGVWVADVVFVHDNNFAIYWISKPDSRHSQAIENTPKIACTITASFEPNNERALQIEGNAQRLEGFQTELEERHYKKRGKPYINSTSKATPKGFVWYKLAPTKVELHWSEKFGYARQSITLE